MTASITTSPHHLLAIYALGATSEELQRAYDDNKGYQRKQYQVKERNVEDMSNNETFKKFLGKEQYFTDFQAFFQNEIDTKGWQKVLQEQLFAKNRARGGYACKDVCWVRPFPLSYLNVLKPFRFYHPIIHLGYGVEFEQPAIIAEALAEAAIHDAWPAKFFFPAEKAAQASQQSKSLHNLMNEIQTNKKLRDSPHWEDGNKVRDGVFVRAPEEMIALASSFKVTPSNLDQKTAEMINNAIYFAAGSQRPNKAVKFDFFYMHCVNCSIFFSAFLNQPWLSTADKCRLVEWKGRFDLALYVSRGCPAIDLSEITNYKPKNPQDGWAEIIRRVDKFPDDGHSSKLIRAIAHGELASKPYDKDDAFIVKSDMFLQIGHMAIDSVEGGGQTWVRNAGFDQAWEKIPDRAKL